MAMNGGCKVPSALFGPSMSSVSSMAPAAPVSTPTVAADSLLLAEFWESRRDWLRCRVRSNCRQNGLLALGRVKVPPWVPGRLPSCIRGVESSASESLSESVSTCSSAANTLRLHTGQTRRFFVNQGSMHFV